MLRSPVSFIGRSAKSLRTLLDGRSVNALTVTINNFARSTVVQHGEKKPSAIPTGLGTTVNQGEVDRHSKMAQDWWNPNGSVKALHAYNSLRVPFVRDGLLECNQVKSISPLSGKSILDVGCGGGILAEPLARLGAKVTGIDASQEMINIAREHSASDPRLDGKRPTYILTSVEEHAKNLQEPIYDGVIASEIIEHVESKELFIESSVKCLKPGGRLFITTPSKTRLSQLFGIYVAEYVLQIVPKGTHQYKKFTTPSEVTYLLERNKCHVELIHGAFYNVLGNTWTFTETTAFIFFVQAVKLS